MDWMGLLLGTCLGFALSLVLWWVQFRVLVPRIAFAESISRLSDDGGRVYRVKFTNTGRRAIIDVQLDVRVYFGKGLLKYSEAALAKTVHSIKIDTSTSTQTGIMRVKPGTSRIMRLNLRRETWADVNPRVLAAIGLETTPPEEEAPLEDLLGATEATYMCVRILAFDEVSGTRKYFESRRYRLADITIGKFHRLAVVETFAPPVLDAVGAPVVEAVDHPPIGAAGKDTIVD